MCIPLMNVGETAEITCAPRFSYGSIGLKSDDGVVIVPPDSTIRYTVELHSTKPEEDIEELNFKMRKTIGFVHLFDFRFL